MDRQIGKIKWFSSDRSSGVLASVGGISLVFTCAESIGGAAAFTEGQIVTYKDRGEGQPGQGAADDVRAQA